MTYEAFSTNPNYANGQTNQLPPAGTIARGFMPHPMNDDGTPALMENPYEMTEFGWKRGEKLYKTTCTACHGGEGLGDGLVVEKGGFPKPPSFQERRFKYSKKESYPAGEIYNVITFGRGNMPSHAQQLYPEDRWYVSEFVREKLMTR